MSSSEEFKILQITTAQPGAWAVMSGPVTQVDGVEKTEAWLHRVTVWCLVEDAQGNTSVTGMSLVGPGDILDHCTLLEELGELHGYVHGETRSEALRAATKFLKSKSIQVPTDEIYFC